MKGEKTFGDFEFVHLWIKNATQQNTQNTKLSLLLFGGKSHEKLHLEASV